MIVNSRNHKLFMIGPLFFLALHLMLIIVFDLQFIYFREDAWQNIPVFEMKTDPLFKIFLFHSQPPGFNLFLLLIDQFGSNSEKIFHLLYILFTCLCIWMLSDTVNHWIGNKKIATSAGIVYAILPGTHLYTMWGFNTQLVAMLTMLSVWSFTLGKSLRNNYYFALCGLSILMIFLVRATFIWFVAVFYLGIVLLSIGKSRNKHRLRFLFINSTFVLIILFLTAKNILLFGISSQSSWASENFAKMLVYSISAQEVQSMSKESPCYKELLAVGVFQDVRKYPICTSRSGTSYINPPKNVILDSYVLNNGMLNYNHKNRLVLESQWRDFNYDLVSLNPKILLRGLFPSFTQERRGSLVQYLWPNIDYKFIEPNTTKLGLFGLSWLILLSPLPFINISVILLFTYLIMRKSIVRNYVSGGLVFALFMVMFFSVAYIFVEIGENQRYRTEIDPILVACSITSLYKIRSIYNLGKV
jgi:hypothetical protein